MVTLEDRVYGVPYPVINVNSQLPLVASPVSVCALATIASSLAVYSSSLAIAGPIIVHICLHWANVLSSIHVGISRSRIFPTEVRCYVLALG